MDKKTTNDEMCTDSFLDNLTGLYNRNAFFILAQHQLKIASRTKRWLSLLLVDVKMDNTASRSKGDRTAVDIAALLKRTFRNSDIISRLGEYEFAILAIEAHYSSSHLMTTRLLENLEDHNSKEKNLHKLTLNLGTSFFDPDHPCSLVDLLARASATML